MPISPYEAGDLETMRDALTRELLPQARWMPRFEQLAPPIFHTVEVGDEIVVTHQDGYGTAGAGWGSRIFERRHCEVEGIRWNPGQPAALRLTLADLRGGLQRTNYESGIIREFQDQLMLGCARALAGPRDWFRASSAWVEDPAGGYVTEVRRHVPKCSANGLLIERAGENIVRGSFMTYGLGAPWLSSVSGNGQVTADTALLLFTGGATGQNYKIKNDSLGGAGPTYVEQTVSAGNLPANGDKAILSIDHLDPDGTAPQFFLHDSTNAKAFNPGTGGWDPSGVVIWYAIPLAGSAQGRYTVVVPFTASIASLRCGFGWPNTAAGSGKTTNLFAYEIVWGRAKQKRTWAASRIFTDNVSDTTRSGDVYIWGNDSGVRCWNASQGTALFLLKTLWNSADVAGLGLVFELLRVAYDQNNYVSLYYDGDLGKFVFRRRQAGINTDLQSGAVTITAGTQVTVALRWASANGELDDVYGAATGAKTWFDMIINGTRVAGQQSVPPTETPTSNVYIGGTEGQQVDGYLRPQFTPYVLSEAECKRWLV
jgi:hypothetical protein